MSNSLQASQKKQLSSIHVQNTPFCYRKYHNILYVPVYPRGYVQEIIGIDYERRTVTARFVIAITVSLVVPNGKMKKYLRDHLHIEFPFNQVVMIPEVFKVQNTPFIVRRQPTDQKQPYATYTIRGNIQCPAQFDLTYFPYRRIQVNNHFCIRTQQFDGHVIKYNAMMLWSDQFDKKFQFSPFFNNYQFGAYRVTYNSNMAVTDQSEAALRRVDSRGDVFKYMLGFLNGKNEQKSQIKNHTQRRLSQSNLDVVRNIFGMAQKITRQNHKRLEQQQHPYLLQSRRDQFIEQLQQQDQPINDQFSSYKHMSFSFQLTSFKIAFVLKQQIPLWILVICSLFLFGSDQQIQNRMANILLLLVSYIAIFTSFRESNVGQPDFSWYQFKMSCLMILPLLLTISTTYDFYNPEQANARENITQNNFFVASLAISAFFFVATFIYLLYIPIKRWIKGMKAENKAHLNEQLMSWHNMSELEWHHPNLVNKMANHLKDQSSLFIHDQKIKKKIQNILNNQQIGAETDEENFS